ncbi:MAG TPA: enoyl-CoA hydratase-related protein [Candidatus Dormibacteraeota bacterium]|nr:enoyl-CoA hydratase-related protein [Candidatus Dormibacteraeota bacterium]
MTYEDLTLDIDAGVAVVTLNRPAQRNAFSGPMATSLAAAYRACDADDAVRAVVLTGAGAAFCVGADLTPGGATFERREEADFSADPVAYPAWEVRKPVIAAINGHAVGIGLTLAMQCDIRLAARGAKLGFAHVRRGVLPDAHAHWTVPRAVGHARAAELFLTGRLFDGEEAAAMGLVSRALPAADVLGAALAMARDIADHCAPLSVALSKRLLWESRGLTRDEVGARETAYHHLVMGRPDALEGVMAFLERRPPRWSLAVPRDWPDDL